MTGDCCIDACVCDDAALVLYFVDQCWICVDGPTLSLVDVEFFFVFFSRFDIVGTCAATCLGLTNSPQVTPFNSSAGGSHTVRRYSCC